MSRFTDYSAGSCPLPSLTESAIDEGERKVTQGQRLSGSVRVRQPPSASVRVSHGLTGSDRVLQGLTGSVRV